MDLTYYAILGWVRMKRYWLWLWHLVGYGYSPWLAMAMTLGCNTIERQGCLAFKPYTWTIDKNLAT